MSDSSAAILALFAPSTLVSTSLFLFLVLLMIYRGSMHPDVRARYGKAKSILFFVITSTVLIGWFAVVALLGSKDLFAANLLFVPNIAIGFFILFQILQWVYKSQMVWDVARNIPVHWYVGVQTYRIVGVGFLILYSQNVLPAFFAIPAGVGDIIVGVLAPFVAWLYWRGVSYAKNLTLLWNKAGILDLIIAIGSGVLIFPRPIQWVPSEISTEPIALFPLVVVPLFAVPLALILHLFTHKILKKR